ncbi:TIGR01777 family oxidoreductase [Deminuibacter soli]|uniref:TIGR01777 family protein n=1 Tax=Deminuibacter soli TaxID=2291815 RepID=A0A3E1NEK4_9BACT|nr:TIGR01777 family oxidoreductase [Deminuibacter soli]RFM26198.1 TIGR01777 family protein [Deminuibacter soli]
MATVTITGVTGLVGKRLAQLLLEKGYRVIGLSRSGNAPVIGVQMARWDIKAQTIDATAIEQADFIVHLAGAGVAEKRWTKEYKQEIIDSRVKSGELLAQAMKQHSNKVQAVVCASGVGWYGADTAGSRANGFVETDKADDDFLGKTCVVWEQANNNIGAQTGVRVVSIRTGLAMSNDGGAFAEFKKPQQFGVAAIFGSGEQVISWIHLDDLCRIYIHAIENAQLQGAYNGVAPAPLTNKQLMLMLAKKLRGNFYIPIHVPAFVLKTMLGEMSVEILKSCTVSAAKIKSTGFTFLYPSAEAALEELLKK